MPLSRMIIENAILPQFRRGDFNAGVRDGVAAMLRVLGGSAPVDQARRMRDESSPHCGLG